MNEKRSNTHPTAFTRRRGLTDWQHVSNLTDDEIAAAVANDPDAAPLDLDWSNAVLIPPKKKTILLRLYEDVLDYFRKEGPGYQQRINAVLRSFVDRKQNRRKQT
jgi:uncharacterized protein (DUF4415 family)